MRALMYYILFIGLKSAMKRLGAPISGSDAQDSSGSVPVLQNQRGRQMPRPRAGWCWHGGRGLRTHPKVGDKVVPSNRLRSVHPVRRLRGVLSPASLRGRRPHRGRKAVFLRRRVFWVRRGMPSRGDNLPNSCGSSGYAEGVARQVRMTSASMDRSRSPSPAPRLSFISDT